MSAHFFWSQDVNDWARHSPPDIGADGVVGNGTISKERILKNFVNPDHPVCAAAVASHLFIDGTATLLFQEGSCQLHTPVTAYGPLCGHGGLGRGTSGDSAGERPVLSTRN